MDSDPCIIIFLDLLYQWYNSVLSENMSKCSKWLHIWYFLLMGFFLYILRFTLNVVCSSLWCLFFFLRANRWKMLLWSHVIMATVVLLSIWEGKQFMVKSFGRDWCLHCLATHWYFIPVHIFFQLWLFGSSMPKNKQITILIYKNVLFYQVDKDLVTLCQGQLGSS